jgi:phage gp29-like protein
VTAIARAQQFQHLRDFQFNRRRSVRSGGCMTDIVQNPIPTTPNRAQQPSAGGGKSAAELVRQSNRWRDNYNPIRGLVIARAIAILEAADRGDFAELQLVMRKVERRYPALKGLKARRLAALENLDWEIKVVDALAEGATREEAEAQRTFLRSRYELVENLTETIGFLGTAEFRGYAILQKHRFNDGGKFDGAVREFHWLPQDQFSRNGQFGDFYYNQNSNFGIGIDSCQMLLGEQNRIGSANLPREDFLIREVDSPIYEIALVAFVNWCMGRKDWAAFTEIFGLPNGVAIMPANIPPGMEEEYRMAAERVADGVSGALPHGSDIKFPTSSIRGEAPFKDFCDAQDYDVVLAGTGGRLSMLTADKGGLGDGPALEHADAFDEIAQAEARKINAVLQNDFDRAELAAEFPGRPVLAYFELCMRDTTETSQLVNDAATLVSAGYKVDPAWLSEATGIKFAEGKAASEAA